MVTISTVLFLADLADLLHIRSLSLLRGRVFDGSLAACFDAFENHGTPLKKKYFRCRNNNDIVPRVVPPPYVHVGTEIYLDRL